MVQKTKIHSMSRRSAGRNAWVKREVGEKWLYWCELKDMLTSIYYHGEQKIISNPKLDFQEHCWCPLL